MPEPLPFQEAQKLIPPDIYHYITRDLSKYIHKKRLRLLLYLVASHFKGDLGLEGATSVIKAFYELDTGDDAQKERWRKAETLEYHPGKKLAQELRSKLLDYYNNEGANANIVISLGDSGHIKVDITYQSHSSPDHHEPAPKPIPPNLDSVVCYCVGDDNDGLSYEIEQMEKGYVHMLRDTHVRLDREHREYKDDKLKNFENGLKKFLGQASDSKIEMILGQRIEPQYVQSVINAAKGQEGKVKYYKLRDTMPLLNFAILDYINRDSEVLFGWGRFNRLSKESVFMSSDPNLVNQFEEYYKSLTNFSEELPRLTDLSDYSKTTTINAQISTWSQDKVYKLLGNAESGTEVRMLTTFFMNWSAMLPMINELVKKGVHVKIVMMDPESQLVRARFERREDYPPPKAKEVIKTQLEKLEQICAKKMLKGSLEVRRSHIMPFGFLVQSGKEILIDLMMPLTMSPQSPEIEVKSDSPLGKELEKNWWGYWSIRSASELAEIEANTDAGQIWLFTPDLSNDTGTWAKFDDIVKKNAARGIKYTIIFPNQVIPEKQLQEFRKLFPLKGKRRLGITEIPLEDSEISQLIPDQKLAHIVIFNPMPENNKPTNIYKEESDVLWKKVEGNEAKIILDGFTKVVKLQS